MSTNSSDVATASSAAAAAAPPVNVDADDSSTSSRTKKRIKTKSIFDNDIGDGDGVGDSSSGILSPDLLERKETIIKAYKTSKPFPHSQILQVFRPDFLLKCKEEIKSQTKVNFKESDLFRVYQSIDFANLDPERAAAIQLDTSKLANVMQLRDVLYSQEWRSFVEQCSGLAPGTLIDKIDCACNCHAPGCHLLCHDDVIGTRKISYIIYLTEEDWDGTKEGGALELYGPQNDNDNDSTSTPVPVARAWPIFNSMAFFEVLPGRSFHAVQEVTGDRPRLSLQGWYHSKEPPPQEEMEKATLQQLKSMNAFVAAASTSEQEASCESEKEEEDEDKDKDAFTEEDQAYLKEYIQNEYLTEKSMNEIQTKFEKNSTIQFRNFLLQKWVPTIESNYKKDNGNGDEKKPAAVVVPTSTATANTNKDDDNKDNVVIDAHYKRGVTSEWKVRGPAHKQRYLSFNGNGNGNIDDIIDKDKESKNDNETVTTTGRLLHTVQKQVFESDAFLRYLKRVTSLDKPTGIIGGGTNNKNDDDKTMIRRFRPGLDYTVAHYGLLRKDSVLDATMCFVRDTTEYDQAMWESGDIGGFECYIEADIDDDDDGGGDIGNGNGGIIEQQEGDARAGDGADGTNKGASSSSSSSATTAVAAAKAGSASASSGPADEYNEEDDTELLSVSASNNTLSLVYRDPGTMRFVKYVSSSAPSSRYDICMEYALPPDNDDDDDNDNDNDSDGDGDGDENDGE